MKYVAIAIIFFALGYAISVYLPVSGFGDEVVGDIALPASTDSELDSDLDPEGPPSVAYPEGSYLTELDLLSSPGLIKPLGFRIGPPVRADKADSIIERLAPSIAAVKARYLTANNQPAAIIIAGTYQDFDTANKARATLQLSLNERIEIIYLPDCIEAGTPNSEGFLCVPEEAEVDAPAAAGAS